MIKRIQPRSGTAFTLTTGQYLTVMDPCGEQVADLVAFGLDDTQEYISSGRSIDYAGKIYLTSGDVLYSNRSRPLLSIIADTVGRHDFLLTPCSTETFKIIYGDNDPHIGCFGNLVQALKQYQITPDRIPVAFNVFMNVEVDALSGRIDVRPPKSKARDYICFRAERNLVIGLTACSAPQSNNGSFKPIDYYVSTSLP